MALIDILTHYGLKKRSANVAKTVKYGDQEISTVKPKEYSKRFIEFINKILV
jgi:1-phosphatidylinositol-5-phosphate 4-kinase